MCVFELTGNSGGPRHLHHDLDEWIYVIEGEFEFQVGGSSGVKYLRDLKDKPFRVRAGESVFLPRKVAHVWGCVSRRPGKIINMYKPAGKMEDFREAGKHVGPFVHEVLSLNEFRKFFSDQWMTLLSPPLGWDKHLADELYTRQPQIGGAGRESQKKQVQGNHEDKPMTARPAMALAATDTVRSANSCAARRMKASQRVNSIDASEYYVNFERPTAFSLETWPRTAVTFSGAMETGRRLLSRIGLFCSTSFHARKS